MGKASRLKGLKRVAETLPVIMRQSCEVHYVTGKELLDQGHTEIKPGEPVIPKGKYRQRMPVMIAINHTRNLKKICGKYGAAGLNAYISAVNNQKTLSNAS